MPLIKTNILVEDGAARGYAAPAFNIYNLESAQAIMRTAKRLKAPVILQIYRRLLENETGGCLAAAVKYMAAESRLPVGLHLDHGADERECIKAVRIGCSGVMIDGSSLSFEENVALTARVSEACRWAGVPAEGELGHVGSAAKGDEGASAEYTSPKEAAEFCQRTGVSMLAVMVGSAHGIYKKAPKLDIDRIAKIREATGVPLVLHGGSGIPDEEIRAAIEAGISKINVATDVCQAYYKGFRNRPAEDEMYGKALDVFMQSGIEEVEKLAEEKIRLLGAAGKADM